MLEHRRDAGDGQTPGPKIDTDTAGAGAGWQAPCGRGATEASERKTKGSKRRVQGAHKNNR